MTGSAFQVMDVVVAIWRKQKGGGLEEGGLKIHPDRRGCGFFGRLYGLRRRVF